MCVKRAKKPLPGPGAYDVASQGLQACQTSISSPFASKVPRSNFPVKRNPQEPPGPAFYKASLPGRKSFHLNARKRFVPVL